MKKEKTIFLCLLIKPKNLVKISLKMFKKIFLIEIKKNLKITTTIKFKNI
jgi:hypothetical protein